MEANVVSCFWDIPSFPNYANSPLKLKFEANAYARVFSLCFKARGANRRTLNSKEPRMVLEPNNSNKHLEPHMVLESNNSNKHLEL